MARKKQSAISRHAAQVGAQTAAPEFQPRRLAPRVRVLPLTMVMLFLLFSVKVTEVYQGGRQIQLHLQEARATGNVAPVAAIAFAQEEKGAKPPPEISQEEAESLEQQKIAKLKEENDKITGNGRQFSQIEVDLLQSLRERRETIEARARELDLKEKLLDGTEIRINQKIAEIKALEEKVSTLLEQYANQEESHIRSLVKIYESMKPKSAAAIFDELELPILLEVVDQMSERKVAPILAAMNPLKAKEVTADLAELRKLNALKMKR